MERCRQFDVGVEIDAPIVEDHLSVDLTGCTATMRFQPPGGASFDRTAVVETTPVRRLVYETVLGDLAWFGLWRFQGFIHFPGDVPRLRTRIGTFEVEPNLGPPDVFVFPEAALAVAIAPAVGAA